jgi:hypothetical protein
MRAQQENGAIISEAKRKLVWKIFSNIFALKE